MKQGHIALVRFPRTDLLTGKLRPVLLLSQIPGKHDDWLICMISSQLYQQIDSLDEVILENDPHFLNTGLKAPSVIRASRLAVVQESVLRGHIGFIEAKRITSIKKRIADWILS